MDGWMNMKDPRSKDCVHAGKLISLLVVMALCISSVFAIPSMASTPPSPEDQQRQDKESTASNPGNQTIDSMMNITFSGAYQALKILWYDDWEENASAGSIREYLVSKGHTVTYLHDEIGDVNVATSYADYDVVVAEHTCDSGTLVGLKWWFQVGKGYVSLIGQEMYNDPVSDSYITGLLGVGRDGNTGTGWSHSQLYWSDAGHSIRNYPNSGWNLTDLPDGQYQYYVQINNGHTVVGATTGAVLQTREEVEGKGRIAYWGSNYHGSERTNPTTRKFVENMIFWAAMGTPMGHAPAATPASQAGNPSSALQKPGQASDDSWIVWFVFVIVELVFVVAVASMIPPTKVKRERKEPGASAPPQQQESKPPEPPKAP